MEFRFKSLRLTSIAMVVYGIGLGISVYTTGIALVAPFSFIVTCFAAWEMGLAFSLTWVTFVHIFVPVVLLVTGNGPFFMFPDARVSVAIILIASTVAEVFMACLTVRLRILANDLLASKTALIQSNAELQIALDEVTELRGYLPICAWCKDVRDMKGNWEKIESYISRHSGATLTHCLCPKCLKENLSSLAKQ